VAGRADGQTGRFASSFSQFVEKNNDVFVWAVRKRTEGIFFVEFMLHWCFSAERLVAQQAFGNSFVQALAFWDVAHNLYNDVAAFLKNPYNIIDFLAIIPIGFRIAYGISTPEMDSNYAPVHFLLYCFVPVIRQLKLIRKFQKLQLHVLSTTFDALKLLLFLVCLIVLFFGCLLYVLEPQQTQSLSEYIYQCTVTVTTVGTCDMAPTTWPGKIIAGMLCVISVLFMAMPISVLGNAMSNTWADRHRILLMTQTRRRLKNLGYTAEDMPKLFKKFDKDGNGDLEMEEFCDLVATMRVGIKPSEASELFMAFDSNGDGGISEMEFMKALFPLDYRRIYRRMSGMTFGA
ncbi:Potassium voltage-gated channel subfamily B member 1 (Voltage-gated potassium channel subunit Kv2.1), partial [Durusdinium trenchii]